MLKTRNGRLIDPDFLRNEKLYLRCQIAWIAEDDHIKPANIHFPDQSVNREKYSCPADVLLPDDSERSRQWILWGVATVNVEDIPQDMQTTGNVSYRFTAEHDPLEENYSHTELRVYKNGQRESDGGSVNKQVKKEYRTKLGLRTRVIVRPLV